MAKIVKVKKAISVKVSPGEQHRYSEGQQRVLPDWRAEELVANGSAELVGDVEAPEAAADSTPPVGFALPAEPKGGRPKWADYDRNTAERQQREHDAKFRVDEEQPAPAPPPVP